MTVKKAYGDALRPPPTLAKPVNQWPTFSFGDGHAKSQIRGNEVCLSTVQIEQPLPIGGNGDESNQVLGGPATCAVCPLSAAVRYTTGREVFHLPTRSPVAIPQSHMEKAARVTSSDRLTLVVTQANQVKAPCP